MAYVAVPDADLDYSARDEAKLIVSRPSYLRPVWRSAHWRVFAVQRPKPLVSGAARSIELEPDGFALNAGPAAPRSCASATRAGGRSRAGAPASSVARAR